MTLEVGWGQQNRAREAGSPRLDPGFRCEGQSPWGQDHLCSCPWIIRAGGLSVGEAAPVSLAFSGA